MRGLNKVLLIGNLGKDPEIQNFDKGALLAKFPLATTETFKDKNGQRQDKTEWHNIVVWGTLAEVAQKYLRKGMMVYVEGRIQSRQYEDKDGNKKHITEIRAENFQMLERREGAAGHGPQIVEPSAPSDPPGGDMPF